MSSKKQKSKNPPKEKFKKQETLQAIVIVDDFIQDLEIMNSEYPNVLIPVISIPLLDYLIETLVISKVQQAFLYCSSHIETLKSYIESLKHVKDKNIILTPLLSDGCRSLGDAMRDIDTKGCMRNDFILIRGTAFSNVDLKVFMDLHQARKTKDKNTAMTMILRDIGNMKNSLLQSECSIMVSNASNGKVLHYSKILPGNKKIDMELQWFIENDQVQVHSAMIDTHMYICSASVLPLFSDNFDFQTIEDFIKGVLINEEFLDSRIYWEPLGASKYALPFTSLKTYKLLCRDILQRQSYPLVPDNLPLSLRNFIYLSKSAYTHRSSVLSKGCTLHSETIVGESTSLGENTTISKSVIGTNCIIGNNVCIYKSHIISDTVIENGCDIRDCIIFKNCFITEGSKLHNCIILPNVRVCCQEFSNSLIQADCDGNLTSKPIDQLQDMGDLSMLIEDGQKEVDYDDEDASSSSSHTSSVCSRDSPALLNVQDDNEMFLSEVIDSLLRGYQDKLKCENLILEINSSRYAYNVNMRQVTYNVIKAILNLPFHNDHFANKTDMDDKTKSMEYFKFLKPILNYFESIITNYIKSENAQEDCLRAIEDIAFIKKEFLVPCTQHLLHFLYNQDILFEQKILEWYEQEYDINQEVTQYLDKDEIDHAEEEIKQNIHAALRDATKPFIKWLQEAEEDSSGES